MRIAKICYAVFTFAVIATLWPNIVHEPIHAAVAMMQGVEVSIYYNIGFPSEPVVAWNGDFASALGYQAFLLAPSIVAAMILTILLFTKPYVESHVSLPIYLTIELVFNILKFTSAQSDWRILQDVGGFFIAWPLIVMTLLLSGAVISKAITTISTRDRLRIQAEKENEYFKKYVGEYI